MSFESRIYINYQPTHKLSWNCVNNTQANVRGGGGYVTGSGNNLTGVISDVYTTHDVISHTITITYEGPVDLKERKIKEVTVPSYWMDHAVMTAAHNSLNKKKLDDLDFYQKIGCASMVCFPTWICCLPCIFGWKAKQIETWKDSTLQTATNQIAYAALQQKIVDLMKEADELVTERVKYLEKK